MNIPQTVLALMAVGVLSGAAGFAVQVKGKAAESASPGAGRDTTAVVCATPTATTKPAGERDPCVACGRG